MGGVGRNGSAHSHDYGLLLEVMQLHHVPNNGWKNPPQESRRKNGVELTRRFRYTSSS